MYNGLLFNDRKIWYIKPKNDMDEILYTYYYVKESSLMRLSIL